MHDNNNYCFVDIKHTICYVYFVCRVFQPIILYNVIFNEDFNVIKKL